MKKILTFFALVPCFPANKNCRSQCTLRQGFSTCFGNWPHFNSPKFMPHFNILGLLIVHYCKILHSPPPQHFKQFAVFLLISNYISFILPLHEKTLLHIQYIALRYCFGIISNCLTLRCLLHVLYSESTLSVYLFNTLNVFYAFINCFVLGPHPFINSFIHQNVECSTSAKCVLHSFLAQQTLRITLI